MLVRIAYDAESCKLKKPVPGWDDANIDFVFSVSSIVGTEGASKLKAAAQKAGFEFRSKYGKHEVRDIRITGAEAAAVYVASKTETDVKEGDRMVVLDAGGGTSDVTMVIVSKRGSWRHDDIVLRPVSSQTIGGAYVDQDIQESLIDLMNDSGISHDDAMFMAENICRGDGFLKAKEGREDMSVDLKALRPTARAIRSGMKIDQGLLEVYGDCFDMFLARQLFGPGGEKNRTNGIVEQVVTMRDDLLQMAPAKHAQFQQSFERTNPTSETIDVVVFCGGVCKSGYLQRMVKTYLQMVPGELKTADLAEITLGTRFVVPEEPQMCVVNGLVQARVRELETGRSLRTWLKRGFMA